MSESIRSQLKRTQRCKNFNGTIHNACDAGIAYDSVRTGDPFSLNLPCLPNGSAIPCEKREYATAAELDAEAKEIEDMLTNTNTARRAIVAHSGGKRGVAGYIDCPICKTGKLRYDVAAYNGHIWAKCETDGCVSWIE